MRQGLSKNEQQVFDILMGIKNDTDEKLLNSDILNNNESFFEGYIQQQVVLKFRDADIRLNPEVAKLVKNAIVKEYTNEREGIVE